MKKVLVYLLVVIGVGLSLVGLYSYRYDISDWWFLRSYQPAAEIVAIANKVDFTDKGRNLFYVHDPKVLPAESFNRACPNRETTIVLGCYDSQRIYVFQVEDPRLDGIEEVTAAHEMLHAAFERLDRTQKQELTDWLEFTRNNIANQRVLGVIETYDDLGQEAILNELHSIFATEIESLPEYLEQYYSSYFNDRGTVVKLSQAYEQVFTDIKDQVASYDKQLSELQNKVKSQESELENLSVNIDNLRQQLDNFLANDQIQQYNQAIPRFNNFVNSYNSILASIKADISQYNEIVKIRNELSVEQNQLVQSLDSRFSEVEN